VRSALREVVDAVVEARRPSRDAVHLVNAALEARRPTRLEFDDTALRIGHRHADTPIDDASRSSRGDRRGARHGPPRAAPGLRQRPLPLGLLRQLADARRWCDMRSCGNQAKAARYRARLKESAIDPNPTTSTFARPN